MKKYKIKNLIKIAIFFLEDVIAEPNSHYLDSYELVILGQQ